MLTDRIISAFTFRREVYGEVERDTEFTTTAWLLVVVVSFLNSLGSYGGLGFRQFGRWIIASIVGTIFAVIGFAVGAFIINWVAKTLFKADVEFNEVVRTVGLAYVWNVVGVVGVLAAIFAPLGCILAPVRIIAAIASLIAWLFAVKEAVDLDWGETVITIIVGWIATFLITLIAGLVLGAFGIAASSAAGLGR
jgi:hypothetical protein